MSNVKELTESSVIITMPWGDEVLSFKHGGKIYVKIADVTRSLDIKQERQLERIKNHPVLALELLSITPTSIGIQDAFVPQNANREFWSITLRGLYGWLCSMNVDQLRAHGREDSANRLIAFQVESLDVLENYWAYGVAVNPRYVVTDALNKLHRENKLDLSCENDRDVLQEGLIHLCDIMEDYELLRTGVNTTLSSRDKRAVNEGSNIVLSIIRDLDCPSNPSAAVRRECILSFLNTMEKVPGSDILLRVLAQRFLSYHIQQLDHQALSLRGMPLDASRQAMLHCVWNIVYDAVSNFCYDVFREELTENIDLREFIAMTLDAKSRQIDREAREVALKKK